MEFKRKISLLLILVTLTITIFIGCTKQNATTESRDEKIATTQQIDSNAQQLLDNKEFLNSIEGMDYQFKSWHFAKAFFNGDLEYIKNHLMDSNKLEDYNYKNQFNKIQGLIFRFHEYDNKTKLAYGEYIVQVNKDDGLIYLEFRMILDNGEWKIISYSVDA